VTVRTEVRLPDELHARLTVRAETELRSMNSMMLIAMRFGLDEMERRENRGHDNAKDA